MRLHDSGLVIFSIQSRGVSVPGVTAFCIDVKAEITTAIPSISNYPRNPRGF